MLRHGGWRHWQHTHRSWHPNTHDCFVDFQAIRMHEILRTMHRFAWNSVRAWTYRRATSVSERVRVVGDGELGRVGQSHQHLTPRLLSNRNTQNIVKWAKQVRQCNRSGILMLNVKNRACVLRRESRWAIKSAKVNDQRQLVKAIDFVTKNKLHPWSPSISY